jgi:DNA-binding NarL/FixJ family response regulator
MTRVLIIPDENSLMMMHSPVNSEKLIESINTGSWHSSLAILESLQLVLDPEQLQASRMGQLVVITPRKPGKSSPVDLSTYGLTTRQQQVLAGMIAGLTQKEIAVRLGIAWRTVAWHVCKLKKRMPGLIGKNHVITDRLFD